MEGKRVHLKRVALPAAESKALKGSSMQNQLNLMDITL